MRNEKLVILLSKAINFKRQELCSMPDALPVRRIALLPHRTLPSKETPHAPEVKIMLSFLTIAQVLHQKIQYTVIITKPPKISSKNQNQQHPGQ